jgi:hypothetical protein
MTANEGETWIARTFPAPASMTRPAEAGKLSIRAKNSRLFPALVTGTVSRIAMALVVKCFVARMIVLIGCGAGCTVTRRRRHCPPRRRTPQRSESIPPVAS